MKLKNFTGFKGVAMMVEIGGVRFILVGNSELSLRSFHNTFLTEAGEFNPAACKKSIVIEASLLPETKIKSGKPTIIDLK